jgi:hypothetical protein
MEGQMDSRSEIEVAVRARYAGFYRAEYLTGGGICLYFKNGDEYIVVAADGLALQDKEKALERVLIQCDSAHGV